MEYMHSPDWLWKSESFEIVHHILCIVFFPERETGFAKFLKKKKKKKKSMAFRIKEFRWMRRIFKFEF